MQTRAAPELAESNATPAKRPGLRAAMPLCAAFIDEMREAFGAEEINAQVKLGMQGAQTFHASENGIEVGTPAHSFDTLRGITLDRMVIREKTEVSSSSLKNWTPSKA